MPAKTPEKIIEELNRLDDNNKNHVHWKVSKTEAGEEVFTTTTRVANARGVMYTITTGMGINMDGVTWPPKGAGFPVIPVRRVTEQAGEKIRFVDRAALKPLIANQDLSPQP